MKRLLLLAAFLAGSLGSFFGAARHAQAQPSLTRVEPGAVMPGQATELTLHGENLIQPLQVWTSFPAQCEVVSAAEDGKSARIRVTVEAKVPVGVEGLAIGMTTGVTSPYLMLVDDLPSVADNGTNHDVHQAQELSLPVAVDGMSDGVPADYYRFAGKAGQEIHGEVLAARIGSLFDPVLRLLDEKGRELLLVDDSPAWGADCRFEYTLPADGTYTLELRDNRYEGGGRYRLRIGDFPLAHLPYPLGGRGGATMALRPLEASGRELPQVIRQISETRWSQLVPISLRSEGASASSLATLMIDPLPEMKEAESGEAETFTLVEAPCAVSGLLEKEADRDVFRFPVAPGQRLRFVSSSRRQGSPCYLHLRVMNDDGQVLTEARAGQPLEVAVSHTFDAGGFYRLEVSDLLRGGGPEHAYRVVIEPARFTLQLKEANGLTTRASLPAGSGAVAYDVQCQRDGYDGPVTLAVEPADAAIELLNNTIPAGANEARVIVATKSATPGSLQAVRIYGYPAGNREAAQLLATTAAVRGAWPHLTHPPGWLDGLFHFATTSAAEPLFDVEPARREVLIPRQIDSAEVVLTPKRLKPDFKDPLVIVLPDLPAGLSYSVRREGEGEQERYHVQLQANSALPDSPVTVRVVAFGGNQIVTRPLVVGRVEPLTATLRVTSPPLAFHQFKLRAEVQRAEALAGQPVVVRLDSLPAGWTGSTEWTIPADQTSVEIELHARESLTASAPVALVATVTAKVGERQIEAKTPPLELRVQPPQAVEKDEP